MTPLKLFYLERFPTGAEYCTESKRYCFTIDVGNVFLTFLSLLFVSHFTQALECLKGLLYM